MTGRHSTGEEKKRREERNIISNIEIKMSNTSGRNVEYKQNNCRGQMRKMNIEILCPHLNVVMLKSRI